MVYFDLNEMNKVFDKIPQKIGKKANASTSYLRYTIYLFPGGKNVRELSIKFLL